MALQTPPPQEPRWMRWLSRKVLEAGFGRSVALFGALFLGSEAAVGWMAWRLGAEGAHGGMLVAGLAVALGALPLLGAVMLRMVFVVEQARRRLAVMATQDDLTGVYNRRHFLDVAEREWARCQRYNDDVALLLIDIDHFKSITDVHGHSAGDAALVEIARAASQTLRQADLLARFGGEELIVLLPRTDPLGALDVAERIRERVAARRVPWNDIELTSTVSIGVASIGADHTSLDLVLRDADEALFAAKQAGRNCVRAAPIQPRRSGSTYPVISR